MGARVKRLGRKRGLQALHEPRVCCENSPCRTRVDSPFFSTILLLKNQLSPQGCWCFLRKKDPWKEWGRYPWICINHPWRQSSANPRLGAGSWASAPPPRRGPSCQRSRSSCIKRVQRVYGRGLCGVATLSRGNLRATKRKNHRPSKKWHSQRSIYIYTYYIYIDIMYI